MSDIPRRTAARTAKLASLPLGVAGRAAAGWGRRLAGGNSEEISAQLLARSAEQLFAVLGELKGGAMKFGQALSVFEAAVPDELAGPFRESLTKLQHAAPPMPIRDGPPHARRAVRSRLAATVPGVRRGAGGGREHRPGAPRRLARRPRGRGEGAVPGGGGGAALGPAPAVADRAGCCSRWCRARTSSRWWPSCASAWRRSSTTATRPRTSARSPRSSRATTRSWCRGWWPAPTGDGQRVDRRATAVARSSPPGRRSERDRAGRLLAEFHSPRPKRAGLLHADPHPGNFQVLADGRLRCSTSARWPGCPRGCPDLCR